MEETLSSFRIFICSCIGALAGVIIGEYLAAMWKRYQPLKEQVEEQVED